MRGNLVYTLGMESPTLVLVSPPSAPSCIALRPRRDRQAHTMTSQKSSDTETSKWVNADGTPTDKGYEFLNREWIAGTFAS